MKIFVSHALTDFKIIEMISASVKLYGIELLIAEHRIDLEHSITEKIENMIKSCDLALVVLTQHGFDSKFVQQEIGYIKSSEKKLLPIVQSGLENQVSGFIYGRDFITYDPLRPELMIVKLTNIILEAFRSIKAKLTPDEPLSGIQIVLGIGIFVGLLFLLFKK